jgi:hypothetical protein
LTNGTVVSCSDDGKTVLDLGLEEEDKVKYHSIEKCEILALFKVDGSCGEGALEIASISKEQILTMIQESVKSTLA